MCSRTENRSASASAGKSVQDLVDEWSRDRGLREVELCGRGCRSEEIQGLLRGVKPSGVQPFTLVEQL